MGKKIELDICDFCGKTEKDFKSRAAFWSIIESIKGLNILEFDFFL